VVGKGVLTTSGASFEVALFACFGVSIDIFSGFFVLVLVLSVSGTRTRWGIVEYEYEYHFIEYEYERGQNSTTSGARRFPSKAPYQMKREWI
jgi:hypothetical protein